MSTTRLVLLLTGFAALLLVIASLWMAMPSFSGDGSPPEAYAEGATHER